MTIPENIERVRHAMRMASIGAHRDARETELMCVSKFHDTDACLAALRAGERVFGESRVQEAADKWPRLREWFPDARVHMIGQLQSNKAEQAALLFDCIQSIDRPKLARAVAEVVRGLAAAHAPTVMIQVNVAREAQKGGCEPDAVDALVAESRALGLTVVGLMCIPPQGASPVPYFTTLRALAARNDLRQTSMGMSADVDAAIACGSTMVRVGSAIFGARPGKPRA